jgi:hypothetical protein
MRVVLRREGTFAVPGIFPEGQCGVPGQTIFLYEGRASVQRLGSDGFVCDSFAVPELLAWIFSGGQWTASCEQLAGGGIHLLHKLCGDRAEALSFRVGPSEQAAVRVDWYYGDELPTFVPVSQKAAIRRPNALPAGLRRFVPGWAK